MGTPWTRRAIVALVVLVALPACGDDEAATPGSTDPTTSIAPDTTTTTASAEAEPTTTTQAVDEVATVGELADELADTEEGHTGLEQVSLELLVTAGDLAGQSFTDAGYVPAEGPNDCGVDADAAHPPAVLVGAGLVDPDGRSIVEELRVYDDVAIAASAFEAHRTALECGTDGAGTTFGSPVDVNDVVGADAASEAAVVTEDESGVVITALVGDAVLTFTVSAAAATPATLDPREVAAFGVGKVLAALESGPSDG